jgi:hypothetical protein
MFGLLLPMSLKYFGKKKAAIKAALQTPMTIKVII